MKIALVDDDAKFLAQTARLVKLFLEEREIAAEVATFVSAEELLEAINSVRSSDMTFKDSEGVTRIALLNLVLIEAAGHHVIVHVADDRVLVVRQTLQDVWEKLKDSGRFARLGRRSIVNLAHVKRFSGKNLTLVGDKTVTVSRRSLAEFKSAFARFYGA